METVLLTGATSGLGRALAVDLASRAAHLVLHGRDAARLAEVAADVRRRGGDVTEVVADIGDPIDVERLCDEVAAFGSIDLVINNAAAGGGRHPKVRETNRHGTELRMACNVLAPHLIARRLAPALTPRGRIVQVGSLGQAPLDVTDLGFTRGYDGVEAYCRSKLALIMDAMDLAVEGVRVNVVHPAHLMPTTMVGDSGFVPASSIDDGVLPVLRVALDSELDDVRGAYFHRFERREPHPQAADPAVRAALQEWLTEQYERAEAGTSVARRTVCASVR